MGDSAGGGLGLAYAQFIKDEGIKQPAKLVLYSAWIDIGMSNPLIDDMLEYDLLLDKEVLINAGQSYLGDGDAEDPLVSPIFGNFEGLGDILMFYGTHEMIYPDALKFESLANEKGWAINFSFYNQMQHVWILLDTIETRFALEETRDFILD